MPRPSQQPPGTGTNFSHFFRERDAIQDAENNRRFIPSNSTDQPSTLFHLKTNNRCTVPGLRYISRDDVEAMLMYIDGACLNNGRPDSRAGFGVVFRKTENIAGRLERPPQGEAPTSNRAELRAAICALNLRHWPGEGFLRIVLACDSEYVVLGACD